MIGDGLYGPSVVVKGMAHALTAAEAIAGCPVAADMSQMGDYGCYLQKERRFERAGRQCGEHEMSWMFDGM